MSRYKIFDQHGLNFVTLTVVDRVDVFRPQVVQRHPPREITALPKRKRIGRVRLRHHEQPRPPDRGSKQPHHTALRHLRDLKKFTAKTIRTAASNYTTEAGLLDVMVVDFPMSWVGYVPGLDAQIEVFSEFLTD